MSSANDKSFFGHVVHTAMAFAKDTEAYFRAVALCPQLVATESPHTLFYDFEDGNVWAAAQRLANYWSLRCKVYGTEQGLLPLHLALTEADVETLQPDRGMSILTPPCLNESERQMCLFWDRNKNGCTDFRFVDLASRRRCNFFLHQLMMINNTNGGKFRLLLLVDNSRIFGTSLDKKLGQFAEMRSQAICTKCTHVHFFLLSPPGGASYEALQRLLPAMLFRVSGLFRKNVTCVHMGKPEEAIADAEQCGLNASRLPTSMGGSWDYQRYWPAYLSQQLDPDGDNVQPVPAYAASITMRQSSFMPPRVRDCYNRRSLLAMTSTSVSTRSYCSPILSDDQDGWPCEELRRENRPSARDRDDDDMKLFPLMAGSPEDGSFSPLPLTGSPEERDGSLSLLPSLLVDEGEQRERDHGKARHPITGLDCTDHYVQSATHHSSGKHDLSVQGQDNSGWLNALDSASVETCGGDDQDSRKWRLRQEEPAEEHCTPSISLPQECDTSDRLPFEDNAVHQAAVFAIDGLAYFRACAKCPDLIEAESPHELFLRFEEFDVWSAAQRLANYWELRVKVFGDTAAFLPLRFAITAEDASTLQANTGMSILIPPSSGQYSLYWDRTKVPRDLRTVNVSSRIRGNFWLHHTIMMFDFNQREALSRRPGEYMLLLQVDNSRIFKTRLDRMMGDFALSRAKAMCTRTSHVHFFCVSPPERSSYIALSTLLPSLLIRASSLFKLNRITTHMGEPNVILASLERCGFHASGIPTSLGGTWRYQDWSLLLEQLLNGKNAIMEHSVPSFRYSSFSSPEAEPAVMAAGKMPSPESHAQIPMSGDPPRFTVSGTAADDYDDFDLWTRTEVDRQKLAGATTGYFRDRSNSSNGLNSATGEQGTTMKQPPATDPAVREDSPTEPREVDIHDVCPIHDNAMILGAQLSPDLHCRQAEITDSNSQADAPGGPVEHRSLPTSNKEQAIEEKVNAIIERRRVERQNQFKKWYHGKGKRQKRKEQAKHRRLKDRERRIQRAKQKGHDALATSPSSFSD